MVGIPNDPRRFVSGQPDQLKQLIGMVTGVPTANIREDDTLEQIGLDSLRRLTLVSLIEERMGTNIPEVLVTGNITLQQLRSLIGQKTTTETKPISPSWPFRKGIRLLGNVLRDTVLNAIVRIWVSATVEGQQNLADIREPVLIVFNHNDNFDTPVVYRAIPRHIRCRLSVAMAADVMDEHKLLAFIAGLFFAAFRFSRQEPYRPSLEFLGTMVSRRWNIAFAPEGKISEDGKLQKFKNGVGLLAVELGIPVVMVKTIGLYGTVPLHAGWPRKRSKVIVRISQPMYFGKQLDYREVTKTLHDRMAAL